MYWNACNILAELNDDYDPEKLDRSLELHEALNDLAKHCPRIRIERSSNEEDRMLEGYEEFLEGGGEGELMAEAERQAVDIAEYEKWAEEQQRQCNVGRETDN